MKLKPLPKALLVLTVIGGLGYGAHFAMNKGYFKPKSTIEASVPDKIDLPGAGGSAPASSGTINTASVNSSETIRVETLAWNATSGMHYANGGQDTTPDSLMAKRGLKVRVQRQDDYTKMIADLASFAKDSSTGAHFVVIMGDGFPAFAKGANEALKQFDQSVEVVGALGYSRGEDKCIIDKNAKPQGSLIAGVLGDGDINICIKYAADNGIKVNSDPKTYDPEAMNFVGVSSFDEADEKFIANANDRGHPINGTATWTPGDVKVATKRGNIKVLASTKEYAWQMPAVVIGNKQWMAAHPDIVKAFLAAAFEGGELVRSNDQALMKAAAVEAKVYGEQDANYWAKYFKGTTENGVSLGGSTTNGLADNAFLFGLKGADNLYKKVYTVYGNIAVKYFPDNLPKLVPYENVVNTTYLEGLLKNSTVNVQAAATPTYTAGQHGQAVANKSYSIEFDTGKSSFKPASVAVLNELLDQIAVSNMVVQINGHTDRTGNPESNLALSKQRAEAVKKFLMANAGSNFPSERITTRGYGDTQPIGNDAQNRRVEIVLYSN
ncbi:OmpA family protein [Acinetobacter sp.]|uniref:OmpA family protein n=1 Tax=Acinetobacter sp. TaxID=472 RepID=UPI00388E162C